MRMRTRLGVRLIERSTRRFRVTEIGQAFYERCRIVVGHYLGEEGIVVEVLRNHRLI
jgi:DNA-binding transcriptional LysR family regulator